MPLSYQLLVDLPEATGNLAKTLTSMPTNLSWSPANEHNWGCLQRSWWYRTALVPLKPHESVSVKSSKVSPTASCYTAGHFAYSNYRYLWHKISSPAHILDILAQNKMGKESHLRAKVKLGDDLCTWFVQGSSVPLWSNWRQSAF